MNRDTRLTHDKFWRLEPTPKISGLRYMLGLARAGFMLHPGHQSLGCITVYRDSESLMEAYAKLNQLLLSKDGSNVMTVTP